MKQRPSVMLDCVVSKGYTFESYIESLPYNEREWAQNVLQYRNTKSSDIKKFMSGLGFDETSLETKLALSVNKAFSKVKPDLDKKREEYVKAHMPSLEEIWRIPDDEMTLPVVSELYNKREQLMAEQETAAVKKGKEKVATVVEQPVAEITAIDEEEDIFGK